MRNIDKIMGGLFVVAVGAGLVRNEIKYAEQISNVSATISGLTLLYDIGRAVIGDYFGKKSTRIIPITLNYN